MLMGGKARMVCIGSLLLIAVVGFSVYANSLTGSFIWDDEGLIEKNSYIKSPAHMPKIFIEDIGSGNISQGGGKKSTFSYRPLQMLTYMLDYSIWKLDVRGYHLTNIILHILTAISLYLFICVLFKDNFIALLAGVFFVAHPIHTEAIAYISGRADPLAAVFILLTLIMYVKNIEIKSKAFYFLIPFCYILAILSRENSIIIPALILAYHFSFRKRIGIKEFLPICLITALYIVFRLLALRSLMPHLSSDTTLLKRVPGFFTALTEYVRLLIFPAGLHMEYGDKLFSMSSIKAISGLIILFSLITYAFRRGKNSPLVSFSILWFFAALMPSSNIYPLKAYMAEHWLYIPSMGFFLIAAGGLSSMYRRKGLKVLTAAIITGFLIIYGFLTARQNICWKEPIPFYERTLRYAPGSIKVYFNLANLYKDRGMYKEAIDLYNKAIRYKPDFPDSYINLGVVFYELSRYEDAIELYRKAIEIDRDYQGAYYNLGNAYKALGRYEDAAASYKRATEINPDYTDAYNNLGNVYRELGRRKDALLSYKRALEIEPGIAYTYSNLAMIYYDSGNYKEAISLYLKAIELDPGYAYAYNNLGMAYYSLKEFNEAIRYTERAIEINPGYKSAYFNMSLVYYSMDEFDKALEYCDKAVRLGHKADPGFLKLLEPYRKSDGV
ncbi:MAG: tetratricopeptide repeat protein [Candidatus Omnitrophota bacterium]